MRLRRHTSLIVTPGCGLQLADWVAFRATCLLLQIYSAEDPINVGCGADVSIN